MCDPQCGDDAKKKGISINSPIFTLSKLNVIKECFSFLSSVENNICVKLSYEELILVGG